MSLLWAVLIPLYFFGLKCAGSFSATMWASFQPFVILSLGVLQGSESFSQKKILGCALVILGICFKASWDSHNSSENGNIGIKMPFCILICLR